MLKIKMVYSDENGNEKYVMADIGANETILLNKTNFTVERANIYAVVEDIDPVMDDVYVENIEEVKKWLEENRDEFECNVSSIIEHLVETKGEWDLW